MAIPLLLLPGFIYTVVFREQGGWSRRSSMAFHSTGSQCSLSMGPWLSSMWLPILLRAKGFIIGMSKTNVPKRARKEADRFLWLSHGNQLTKFPYYSIHLSKQDLSKFEEWENKPYLLMGKVGKSCCKWTCIVCHFYYHYVAV